MNRHLSNNGKPSYVCYSYDARGECERYSIPQSEILDTVRRVLREEYFDRFTGEANRRKVLAAFRKELEGGRGNVRVMEAHLSKLQNQIAQAEARMLEVPSDMVARIVTRIRELENQRDALIVQLNEAKRPSGELATSLEKRLDAAAAWMDDFDAMIEADVSGDEINRALIQVVEKIELQIDREPIPPSGIRHRNTLVGGVITLSNTGFLANVELGSLGIHPLQVHTALRIAFGVCA